MILAGDYIPRDRIVKLPDAFGSQLIIANLEGPICDAGLQKSNKVGVCLHTLRSDSLCNSISQFAYSLANNHMMDYCEEGLRQTCATLDGIGVRHSGAGVNLYDARQPMILEESGCKIAVFSCCEKQFGVARDNIAGCAEMGVWLYSAIKEIKQSKAAEYVIVSCHAASEFSPWASPKLRSFYHSLIDAGADCIHGHHSHVPQGYEVYKGCPIFYGLGNFAVDVDMWGRNQNHLWSVAIDMEFKKDGIGWSLNFVGVRKDGDGLSIFCLEGEQLENAKRYIGMANAQFESSEMCLACWQEASVALYPRIYAPNTRIWSSVQDKISLRERFKMICFACIDVLSALMGRSYPVKRCRFAAKVAYNLFCCPSHTDMITTYLGVTTGAEVDFRTEQTKSLANSFGLYKTR